MNATNEVWRSDDPVTPLATKIRRGFVSDPDASEYFLPSHKTGI